MIVSQLLSKVGIDTSDVASGLQSFNQVMVQGVGTATQQAQLRVDALSDRISFQKRQLDLLGASLLDTARKHGDGSRQVQQQQLAYDRLAASIEHNTRQLPILNQRLDEIRDKAQRGANAGEQFSTSFTQGLNGILGPAALATAAVGGIYAAIHAGQEAVGDALALREQQNSLRAVTGDFARYNEAVRTAKDQQLLFGGTIKDNIDGVQGLAITAKETGASLADLIDLSQRLTLKSPEQGAGGSRIALVEALSEGNIRSLRQRFEIPAAALEKLKDQSLSVEERLAALSGYLDRIGLSSEAVAGRVDEDAAALRRLNQEVEISTLRFGDELATALGGATTGLARLFGLINENPKALAELQALLAGKTSIAEGDIEHAAQLLRTNRVLDAETGARDSAWARDKLTGTTVNTEALDSAKNRLVLLGASSDVMRDKVIALYETFGHTGDIAAFEKGLRNLEGAANHSTKSIQDTARATKELTDEERERLEARAEQASDRAADAYTRLQTAQQDYQAESERRFEDHKKKLAEIGNAGDEQLRKIDDQFKRGREAADNALKGRREDIAKDLDRNLRKIDDDHLNDVAQRRAEASERLEQIDLTLAERILDLRRAASDRIAELEDDASAKVEERREQAADREQQAAERRAEIVQALATRLVDFDQQQIERRIAAQEQYQDRLTALDERRADQEAQAQKAAEDRQQAYQDRLTDAAEASADRAEDRAQRHADRLEDIRRRAEGQAQQGRITRLTGETFVTEFASTPGGQNDTARLLAEEEERYRIEEERSQRDEERARVRMERDRARQEQAASERLAEIAAQYEEERAAAESAYAEQEAKADEKAARDRARLAAQGADQLAAFEEQIARQEAQAARQEALEDERRARQIEKVREQLAVQEADALADAEKQRARLADDLAGDLQTRAAAYETRRAKAQEDASLSLADAEAAYISQLTKLQEAHASQRAEAEAATQARIEQEADGFARQEEQRAAAYARQQEQLKTALGEQLAAYTDIQVELGNITEAEGARRTKILEAEYLAQAKAQRTAYDAFFGTVFGGMADTSYDAVEDTRSRRTAANPGGGVSVQTVNVYGVQDVQSFKDELRRVVINEVRANGGDVSEYWGGERDG